MRGSKSLVASLTLLAVATVLVACTAVPLASPTSTPSPTPTVTNLTIASAGPKYLETVCPGNAAGDAVDAAFRANPQDLTTIKAAAASARDVNRAQALAFTDPLIVWSKQIQADIKVLSELRLLSRLVLRHDRKRSRLGCGHCRRQRKSGRRRSSGNIGTTHPGDSRPVGGYDLKLRRDPFAHSLTHSGRLIVGVLSRLRSRGVQLL